MPRTDSSDGGDNNKMVTEPWDGRRSPEFLIPYSTARLHPSASPGGTVRTETVLPDRRSTSSGPNLLQTGRMRMVAAAQRHGHVPGRRVPFIGNRVTGAADPPSTLPVLSQRTNATRHIRNLPHTAGWAPTGGLHRQGGFAFALMRQHLFGCANTCL